MSPTFLKMNTLYKLAMYTYNELMHRSTLGSSGSSGAHPASDLRFPHFNFKTHLGMLPGVCEQGQGYCC